jgi:hypothetical protein
VLNDAEASRFSRHILLREVRGAGQEKLLAAVVRIPRLDAQGRACAMWLARSGVGALELPEDDSPATTLDESGLLLASDAGRPVGSAVRERLLFHAPSLRFEAGATLVAQVDCDGAAEALRIVRAVLGR